MLNYLEMSATDFKIFSFIEILLPKPANTYQHENVHAGITWF